MARFNVTYGIVTPESAEQGDYSETGFIAQDLPFRDAIETFNRERDWTMNESERKQAMRDCPILQSYLSTALQDLQFSESDEACSESREARDSGTIYDCPNETFLKALQDCQQFEETNKRWIQRAIELEPGEDGLRYGRDNFTHERIGYYFYMQRVGHGVGFTDDGDDESLQIMADYCRIHNCEGLYFGDNGQACWI
jgi:hypothetical protein